MIRVKDLGGNIVPGVYKNSLGAIIIKDDKALDENKRAHKIVSLEKQVEQLTTMVSLLLNNQKGNDHG